MPVDSFASFVDSPMAPAASCFAVTPSDTQDLPQVTKAIYVGTGGDVVLLPVRATAPVTFRNVPAGAVLDVRVRAIRTSGTTAADI
ncbi:MAG TPA: hypothetical protein PKD92_11375, partial [Novosphingobium sp.]|nr:hypothetical protein [Novosphingobium sp.]